MVVQVEPVVHDGQFFVAVIIDGSKMKPCGPVSGAAEAERLSERLRAVGRALTSLKWG
jgi:hypothetical protein